MIDDAQLAVLASWGGYAIVGLVLVYHYVVAPTDGAVPMSGAHAKRA